MPKTARASTKSAPAEPRVPTHPSSDRHLTARRGRTAFTGDTEAKCAWDAGPSCGFDYGSSRRRRRPMIDKRKEVKKI